MVTPRDYQEQALAARASAWAERPAENRQAVVMATGLGKTITFGAEAAREPGRTLILTHTDELAAQAEAKVKLMAPDREVGVVKAGRNDVGAEIIIGGVQTLRFPERLDAIGAVDRLIIDECHHASAPTYQEIMRRVGSLEDCDHSSRAWDDPGCWECRNTGFTHAPVPATGYTATLERSDGKSLGRIWHDVAFSRGISWAVRRGHLVQPRGYRVEVPSLGSIASASDQQVDRALVDSIAPEAVVDAWLERTLSWDSRQSSSERRPVRRPSTVLFAPLVASAHSFAEAFRAAGVSAAVVWGEMSTEARLHVLDLYERGEITVLCNAMLLTEGWDAPRTKCVIWARPTRSRPLFIQGVGRGLRPWLDGPVPREEQECLVLVLADSTPGLVSIADLSDHPDLAPARDGQTLTALEDQYNLNDLEPDAPNAYAGQLELVEFDPLVAASSRVWNRTTGGALFVPVDKANWVTILPGRGGAGMDVALVGRNGGGRRLHRAVPDVELAMALAEDSVHDLGGDVGKLLADKTRAWRKGVPTDAQKRMAIDLGLAKDVERIMAGRSAGKAGRLSDLTDKMLASRMIDPVVARVNERTGR